MNNSPINTYSDIDWLRLRKNAMAQKGWKRKGPDDWDEKAKSFSSRTKNNDYVDLFVDELPLDSSFSVLDIGSGPGTLALPIAKRVRKVTAIDFSKGMLSVLNQHAKDEKLENITTIQCSWEDEWPQKGVGQHDIAIASRSVGVDDLKTALTKINDIANRYVFISDRIGETPFEADAFRAIGRSFESGPDYIYTLNILYTMGIYPNITVLRPNPVSVYPSIAQALESYRWMFKGLSKKEETELKGYVEKNIIEQSQDGSITVRRNSPVQWALIWWEKIR